MLSRGGVLANERILIVDDIPANVTLASFVLASKAYEIQTAVDAPAVLATVGAFRPHLILMDLQLPGMDGLELTRLLKTELRTRNVIIVAITASALKGDEAKARAAGCDGFLTKPIDTRQLPARIAEYLATKSQPVRSAR